MADILKVQEFVRVRLTRDGTTLYDQSFKSEKEDFTEHTADRVVLSTNMATSQEVSMGGVAVGRKIMLETDRQVQIGLGVTPENKWFVGRDASEGGALVMVGTFSHVWVLNTNTQEARLHYVITD